MPWEVVPVSEIRLAFVHQVLSLKSSVSGACRKFGISRKTGYKWLRRYKKEPQQPLQDHSRQPHTSPRRTADVIEKSVLAVRDTYGWGPRKIHAYLRRQELPLPSIRTVGAVLKRHGRQRCCVRPAVIGGDQWQGPVEGCEDGEGAPQDRSSAGHCGGPERTSPANAGRGP